MMHIVGITEYSKGDRLFTLFETNTESFFAVDKEEMKRIIIIHKMHTANMELLNGNIQNKHWYNQLHLEKEFIHTGSEYILICEIEEGKYKLARHDVGISYFNSEQLQTCLKYHKIANCDIINGKLKSTGTYKITKDNQFEAEIKERYERYVAKSTLLGRQMSFNYTIEGKKVKLIKYTGITKDVIIPKFVTTITEKAFNNCNIETLTLEEGLRYIGRGAFSGCNLSEIIIPQTVEFIDKEVFYRNKRLVNDYNEYKRDKVKILNSRTTVLDIFEDKTADNKRR